MLIPKFDVSWFLNEACNSKKNADEKSNRIGSIHINGTEQSDRQMAAIEKVTKRIESTQIDITSPYNDWLKIGYSFAHSLGENGRSYYHRVSRFYPRYSYKECDKQFDHCLKKSNINVKLGSYFHIAKMAGIDISGEKQVSFSTTRIAGSVANGSTGEAALDLPTDTSTVFNTPLLPAQVYDHLPGLLKDSCDLFMDGIEKDVFLMSALTVASACLPNIEGTYFDDPYSAHLYLFITAPPGSGKGKMKWAKYLGEAIHEQMTGQWGKEREAYELEMERYDNLTKAQKLAAGKPKEPKRKMLYIPANSSNSAFIQALADNNNRGIIFETEGDTVTNTAKQEWGDTSDVYRKAFHHETVSLNRRKDNEYLEIKKPHLAIVLSGTPRQVNRLMPEVENGLFSRFMYYAFEDHSEFKNPFVSHSNQKLPEFFTKKGLDMLALYERLLHLDQPINFQLTEAQGCRFTDIFRTMLTKDKLLLGNDFKANVKRLGLITFRIAMTISALRILDDGDISNPMICSDQDFETAISIVTTLEKHAIAVFKNMPNNNLKGKSLEFYDQLPQQFDRQTYLRVAREQGIEPKSAERYISRFRPKLLNHEHNHYTKISK